MHFKTLKNDHRIKWHSLQMYDSFIYLKTRKYACNFVLKEDHIFWKLQRPSSPTTTSITTTIITFLPKRPENHFTVAFNVSCKMSDLQALKIQGLYKLNVSYFYSLWNRIIIICNCAYPKKKKQKQKTKQNL